MSKDIADPENFMKLIKKAYSGVLIDETNGIRMYITLYPVLDCIDIVFLLPAIDFCHVNRLSHVSSCIGYDILIDSESMNVVTANMCVLLDSLSSENHQCFVAIKLNMKDGSVRCITFDMLILRETNVVSKEDK